MSWEFYYDKLGIQEKPRLFYADALQHIVWKDQTSATDFGCGTGVEVEDLVRRDFLVHAYDQSEKSIELSRKRIPQEFKNKINFYQIAFENITSLFPVDFFHSFHALPFCKKEFFYPVVEKTIDSVKVGGIYAVTFFGVEDEWCINGLCTSITIEEIKKLLIQFEMLHLKELKAVGTTAAGEAKMWHVIEVIARRKAQTSL